VRRPFVGSTRTTSSPPTSARRPSRSSMRSSSAAASSAARRCRRGPCRVPVRSSQASLLPGATSTVGGDDLDVVGHREQVERDGAGRAGTRRRPGPSHRARTTATSQATSTMRDGASRTEVLDDAPSEPRARRVGDRRSPASRASGRPRRRAAHALDALVEHRHVELELRRAPACGCGRRRNDSTASTCAPSRCERERQQPDARVEVPHVAVRDLARGLAHQLDERLSTTEVHLEERIERGASSSTSTGDRPGDARTSSSTPSSPRARRPVRRRPGAVRASGRRSGSATGPSPGVTIAVGRRRSRAAPVRRAASRTERDEQRVHLVDRDGAVRDGDDLVAAGTVEPEMTVGCGMQLHVVAVAEVWADRPALLDERVRRVAESTEPCELLAHDPRLERARGLRRDVLQVAAAALLGDRARRGDAVRARDEHLVECPRPARVVLDEWTRTRSPGSAPATSTTLPSIRPTPSPPWAKPSTMTSIGVARFGSRSLIGAPVVVPFIGSPSPTVAG
jgi:hypothetical protein